ncbi:NAD(P)-dependent oxidoreductase [Virgibacillus sp. L01]|uniref:NAD(P)-dependent oxidoreductase n=1 Tax=Virgibacillus sp. L01 TaxID=3457429 RepID=UPI003FCFF5D4
METIGVIGCGLMGRGIVRNLMKSSYRVLIYDIDKEAVQSLVNDGAEAYAGLTEMAVEVDYLILSLPSPELVKKTLVEEGVIDSMRAGTKVMDMSTNDVEVTKWLYEYAETRGIDFFDCPLSGGPAGSEDGKLTIMVGGYDKLFPSLLPVLNSIGKHIEYIGPSGAGQTVKLCHNMVVGGVITLLSETFLTGERSGVSKDKIASILQNGSAQTKVMEVFGQNILDGTFDDVNFSLTNMLKDIDLYRNLAEAQFIPTYVSQPIDQLYRISNHKGRGKQDSSAVYNTLADIGKKG